MMHIHRLAGFDCAHHECWHTEHEACDRHRLNVRGGALPEQIMCETVATNTADFSSCRITASNRAAQEKHSREFTASALSAGGI